MEEHLLIEYHQDLLEGADKAAVEAWLGENPDHRAEYTQCVRIWLHAAQAGALEGLDQEGDLQAVHARLGAQPTRSRNPIWRIAAVVLVAIGLSWGGYQLLGPAAAPPMLSLETGDSPGELFALSDGSQVRLNAHSRLRYPKAFDGDRREVELEGEAWFEVAADKAHPFVIRHGASRTAVVGTQFDVRAYPEEASVWVTVMEGVVRLESVTDTSRSVTLTEGETGEFATAQGAPVKLAQPRLHQNAWRTGELEFVETPLPEVLTTLEKHFGVTITLKESENYEKCLLSATFEDTDVEQTIETLALVFGGTYTIDGNEITILHVNC